MVAAFLTAVIALISDWTGVYGKMTVLKMCAGHHPSTATDPGRNRPSEPAGTNLRNAG